MQYPGLGPVLFKSTAVAVLLDFKKVPRYGSAVDTAVNYRGTCGNAVLLKVDLIEIRIVYAQLLS